MASQRPNFNTRITHVFLGIDFGTSFTKVSYTYAPSNNPQIHTLKWEMSNYEDGYVIPTVLYVKDKKLYFEKPDSDFCEIKYFKYSILESLLVNNHQDTKNKFEELCCVYYLAQIIKRSLLKIKSELKIEDVDNLQIVSINMGVPLENFYEQNNQQNKEIYDELLDNAVVLAGGSKVKVNLPENCVLLDNLDSVISELKIKEAIRKDNCRVNVYPELAAEILLYHQSKNTPDGVYAIIDIGGGTVDIALFQKKQALNSPNELNCLGQKILPLGIEILSRLNNRDGKEKEFCDTFWEIYETGKNLLDVDRYETINIFFFGGGSFSNEFQWYKGALEKRNNGRLDFKRDINSLIDEKEGIIIKNQRLLISQMLAKSVEEMGAVKAFPDFYKAELEERLKTPAYSEAYKEEMEELAKNSGWDDSTV